MPRKKAEPLPDVSARNWRKRAEQMRLIADAVESPPVREVLMRRAADFFEKAQRAEQHKKNA